MSPAAYAAKKSAKENARKKKKRQARPHLPVTRQFYSVAEFCDAHGISRSTFYNLQAAGKGPVVTVLGSRRLISEASAAKWRSELPTIKD